MVAKETRSRKRSEAEARQAAYNRLTEEQKLARVESRRGNSTKERARLAKHVAIKGFLDKAETVGTR